MGFFLFTNIYIYIYIYIYIVQVVYNNIKRKSAQQCRASVLMINNIGKVLSIINIYINLIYSVLSNQAVGDISNLFSCFVSPYFAVTVVLFVSFCLSIYFITECFGMFSFNERKLAHYKEHGNNAIGVVTRLDKAFVRTTHCRRCFLGTGQSHYRHFPPWEFDTALPPIGFS